MKTLYWIDDTHDEGKPPKPPAQKRLEKGLSVELQVVTIENRKQFDGLLAIIDGNRTCGVIMDYQLSKVGEGDRMAFGNTWAAEIRAAYPSVPVIGISHARECDIPRLRLEGFLAFFPRERLMGPNPPLGDITALLEGFSQVYRIIERHDNRGGSELMLDLLQPPQPVADLVRSAVPSSLRGPWDVDTPHTAGRWIWHEFQGRPGFLFDAMGLATSQVPHHRGLESVPDHRGLGAPKAV